MCLSSLKDIPDPVPSVGYKVFVLRPHYITTPHMPGQYEVGKWHESTDMCYITDHLHCETSLELYTPGFHVFLSKEDAFSYMSSFLVWVDETYTVFEVELDIITAFGLQYIRYDQHGNKVYHDCGVYRKMRLVREVPKD
jgi:hypothetical protein